MSRAENISSVAYGREAKKKQPHLGDTEPPVVIRSHVETHPKWDVVRRCIRLLETVFPDPDRAEMSVLFWDGTTWGSPERSAFTLILKHPGAFRAIFSSRNELCIGEAYIYDDFDIEGDVEAACKLGTSNLVSQLSPLGKLRFWPLLWVSQKRCPTTIVGLT